MSDVYVYRFTVRVGDAGESVSPNRRGTLTAIKCVGEPIMESQLVADRTEVDSSGFLTIDVAGQSLIANDYTVEIRSLRLRAASRDRKAMTLNETTDGVERYMLQLESRELLSQARKLERQQTDAPPGESVMRGDAEASGQFAGLPSAR